MTFAPEHVAMASCSDSRSSGAPVDQLYSSLEDYYIEASIMLQYNI